MQWGAGGVVWLFSPILRYFALGSWKEACMYFAKLIGSLGVGTFTSSGHQAGVSTQQVCHFTHPWGSSKGSSGIADWVHLLYHQMPLLQAGTLIHVGLRLVGLPGLLQQIGTNLQFHLNWLIMSHSQHLCGLI